MSDSKPSDTQFVLLHHIWALSLRPFASLAAEGIRNDFFFFSTTATTIPSVHSLSCSSVFITFVVPVFVSYKK